MATNKQRNNKQFHAKCLKLVSPDVNESTKSEDIVVDLSDSIQDVSGDRADDIVGQYQPSYRQTI